MHVDSFLVCDLDSNDAYIFEDVINKSIIDMYTRVNIKTDFHVFDIFIKKMKIDVKRIIKRRNANIASWFLNCNKSYFLICESIKSDIIVFFFSFLMLYCKIANVDCDVITSRRFVCFRSFFCCLKIVFEI